MFTRQKFLYMVFISILAVSVTGCASVTTGRYQRVPIDSNPQEAKVTISSGFRGITPCSFELQRNMNHVITIAKKGYRTAQINLKKTVCGSTAGNILLGGFIGLGIDAMTGAMFKIVPENVYVDLVPGDEDDIVVVETVEVVEAAESAATEKETEVVKEEEEPAITENITPSNTDK